MTVHYSIAIQEDDLHLFPLEGLLPGENALSVNTTALIISLVSTRSSSGNPILLERPVTEPNMRLLLPLLVLPHCCPHEFLRASLFCSYDGLLAGLFSSDNSSHTEWLTMVAEQRLLLQAAHRQGTRKKDLRPVYKVLSDLRHKLHPFGLEIANASSCSAYALLRLS